MVKEKKKMEQKNQNDKVVKKDDLKAKINTKEELVEVSNKPCDDIENREVPKEKSSLLSIILVIGVIALIVLALVVSVLQTNEKNKYFNTITYNDVSEIIDDEDVKVIYWASPTCGYCTQFKPTLLSVSHEYKLDVYYLDVSKLNDEEIGKMYDYLSVYDESYESNSLGTPSLILFKNNKVIDISVGVLNKEQLEEYLSGHSIIRK